MFQHYNSFGVVHLFMFLLLEVPCHHCFVSVSINRLLAHQHQSNIKTCSSLEYFLRIHMSNNLQNMVNKAKKTFQDAYWLTCWAALSFILQLYYNLHTAHCH